MRNVKPITSPHAHTMWENTPLSISTSHGHPSPSTTDEWRDSDRASEKGSKSRSITRRSHKKSRLGCQNCKQRRIKVGCAALNDTTRSFADKHSAMKEIRSVLIARSGRLYVIMYRPKAPVHPHQHALIKLLVNSPPRKSNSPTNGVYLHVTQCRRGLLAQPSGETGWYALDSDTTTFCT